MKKLMTALTVCAVASYAIAATNVVSRNVVGYLNIPVNSNQYQSIAFNFDTVGGGDTKFSDLQASPAFQAGDVLLKAEYSGLDFVYVTYTWRDQAYLDAWELEGTPGFYNNNDESMGNSNLPTGAAYWFFTATQKSVLLAGEVYTGTTADYAIPAHKYTMIGSGFPIAFVPNDYVWTGISAGDQLLVPGYIGNDFVYTTYTWRDQAYLDAWELEGTPGFYNNNDEKAGVIAVEGFGLWVYTDQNVSMSQPSPL